MAVERTCELPIRVVTLPQDPGYKSLNVHDMSVNAQNMYLSWPVHTYWLILLL